MRPIVTIEGIDQALSGLKYSNENSLKYRLVHTVRGFYIEGLSIESLSEITSEDLVMALWDTGDDQEIIRNRKKNLNSIKSTVNADLKRLFKEGHNPEGIVINRKNVFDMSDEAKSQFLESFSGNVGEGNIPLGKIADVLKVVNDFLTEKDSNIEDDSKYEQLKELIKEISGKIGISGSDVPNNAYFHEAQKGTGDYDQFKENSIGDGIEIIKKPGGVSEPDDEPEDEIEEVLEDDESEDEIEELQDDEELEEVEVEDELEDEIAEVLEEDKPEDDIEEVLEDEESDDEVEELEDNEDLEEIELEDDEDLEEVEVDDEPEDEIEEILEDEEPEDEFEEIGDDEDLEEVEVDDEPEDEIEEVLEDAENDDEVKELEDDEDLEEVEVEDELEEDIEEVLEDDESEDDVEELEDDEDLEEVEVEDEPEDEVEVVLEDDVEEAPKDEINKARLLADEFDRSLSEMDRFYNQYILIPKGKYILGRVLNGEDEEEVIKIRLNGFYFGKFPVTNNLFEVFVEKTGYITTAEKLGYGTVYTGRFQRVVDQKTGMVTIDWSPSLIAEKVEGACWHQPNGPGSNLHGKRNHPVVQVSFKDAMSFASWTGKQLPSEIEWEAATRTSKGYDCPWGNRFRGNCCNIESSYTGDTTPVDKYNKNINRYGIADALGNVLEWTRDKTEIKSGQNSKNFEYIAKGGSWVSNDQERLFHRTSLDPVHTSNILGFRCVAY